jgi:hypothetical protein
MPQSMADEDDAVLRVVIGFGEHAPVERCHAERREEPGRDGRTGDSFGRNPVLFGAEVVRAGDRELHRVEGATAFLPGEVIGKRRSRALRRIVERRGPNDDQSLGVRQRKRVEQRGVHDAENRSVGPQCEGHDDDRGEH